MKKLMLKTGLTACLLAGAAMANAEMAPDFVDKMTSETRPEADKIRDGSRRPYQVMNELEVDAGMTVMDIGSGGGWYAWILSAAVGENGHVVAQFGPRALQRNNGQAQRDVAAAMGNAEAFFGEVNEHDANSIDRAITALNIHHFTAERAGPYFQAIYDVLKPGGMVAVIDHIGMPGMENGMMHRMIKDDAEAWLEDAGFEIVKDSDLLRTNADDHQRSISDPIYGRDVDRFLFVARKPG
ncbi:MAG: methyltransferase domain-containing protein [Pseudohongiellaceae bacterium]|jgi:predicted methyltransferase